MARRELADVVAEKALLGCLLRSEHDYWRVCDALGPESFSVGIHREIYASISDVLTSGKKLSHTVLTTRLPEEADEIEVGPYLATLAANAAELSATDFVDTVADLAARRRLVQIGQALSKAAKDIDKPSADTAAECEAAVLDVMQSSAPKRPKRIDELAKRVVASSFEAQSGGSLPGFDTGLPSLDEIMGLMLPGDLIAVLGAQAEGKSSLITQIGMHAARRPPYLPVLMFQIEMSAEQIAARELAATAGMSVREIREGSYTFDGIERIKAAQNELAGPEFWVLDQPKITVRQMRAHCLAMKRTSGIGLVIVDHLRLVRGETRTRDRWERQEQVTGDLKILGKELGVPVLLAAQRTRKAQRNDDPTPNVDDADAPSLDQDCDTIIAIWRRVNHIRRNRPDQKAGEEEWSNYKSELAKAEKVAEIIALKLRSGKAGEQRQFGWDGKKTRVVEL